MKWIVSQLAEMYHAVKFVVWNVQQCHSYFWLLAFLFVTSQMQQNSFNLTSTNPKVLIMWYCEESNLRTESFVFYQNKVGQWNRPTSGTYLKRPLRNSVHQPLWYLLTPCLSYPVNFIGYKYSRKHKKDANDLEPPDEGDIQMEYSSD